MNAYRFPINPFHPLNVSNYKGQVHGTDAHGLTDVEFPTIRHAAAWVQTMRLEHLTIVRDSNVVDFKSPVVVQVLTGTGNLEDFTTYDDEGV